MYEAFGRGDVPAILACLADDVEWEYGANSTDVPWLQPRRGRAAVGGFFESLAAIEIHKFVPKAIMDVLIVDKPVVVSLVDLEATVRATGRRWLEEDEVHIWHFDANGKVRRFRHRVDTHQTWLAFK